MKHIALVMGAFHRARVEDMLDEARRAAKDHGLGVIAEVWVQGSLEKPLALKRLLLRSDVDGSGAESQPALNLWYLHALPSLVASACRSLTALR